MTSELISIESETGQTRLLSIYNIVLYSHALSSGALPLPLALPARVVIIKRTMISLLAILSCSLYNLYIAN